MALDGELLEDLLVELFDNPTSNFVEAGQAWADMYAPYAAEALSCGGGSPLEASIDAAKATMAATLSLVFENSTVITDTADAISLAMTVFWLGNPAIDPPAPPMVFDFIPPAIVGAVTAVPGTAVLKSALLSLWVTQNPVTNPVTAEQSAVAHVPIIEAFTTAVIVSHAGASPCTGPIG